MEQAFASTTKQILQHTNFPQPFPLPDHHLKSNSWSVHRFIHQPCLDLVRGFCAALFQILEKNILEN